MNTNYEGQDTIFEDLNSFYYETLKEFIEKNHFNKFSSLLSHIKFDLNLAYANSSSVLTLLHSAVYEGRIDFVRLLLEKGASANSENELYGIITPLFACKNHLNIEMVQLLIDHGADVNASGLHVDTPLLSYAKPLDGNFSWDKDFYLKSIRLLLEGGADIVGEITPGIPLLTWIEENKKLFEQPRFVQMGTNPTGETVYRLAAPNGKPYQTQAEKLCALQNDSQLNALLATSMFSKIDQIDAAFLSFINDHKFAVYLDEKTIISASRTSVVKRDGKVANGILLKEAYKRTCNTPVNDLPESENFSPV